MSTSAHELHVTPHEYLDAERNVVSAFVGAALVAALSLLLAGCPPQDDNGGGGGGGTTPIGSQTADERKLTADVERIADEYHEITELRGLPSEVERWEIIHRMSAAITANGEKVKPVLERLIKEERVPRAMDLLAHAAVELTNDDLGKLATACHSDAGPIRHAAAVRYEWIAAREGRVASSPYVLGLFVEALSQDMRVADARTQTFRRAWTIVADRLGRLTGMDFGVSEHTQNADDLDRRRAMWRDWFELNRPYLYLYVPPSDASRAVATQLYWLDHAAIGAGTATSEYRKLNPWPVPKHPDEITGYGSPTYDSACFVAWEHNQTRYGLYDANRRDYKALEAVLAEQ